jgi:hypothetical protein
MFNAAIHGQGVARHLSTDHDPLFEAVAGEFPIVAAKMA